MEKETSVQGEETKGLKTKESLPTKLSYKEQRLLETLPHQIETLEADITAIKKCLENPDCYGQKGLSTLSADLQSKENALEPMIEELLLLEEKVEQMQRG